MSLIARKNNCTLAISWPANCCAEPNRETLKFIVVVVDAESGCTVLTTPLLASSLVLRVAIPPYFSSSAHCLVVTVHLCQALVDEAGWKTVKSLATRAIPYGEEFDWQQHQSHCEHGPTGRQYTITSHYR